jgi:hypothetical protein
MNRITLFTIISVFALLLLGAWFNVVGAKKTKQGPSFRSAVWPTIQSNCVKCHRFQGNPKKPKKKPAGDLDLSSWKVAYKSMVDVESKQAMEGYNIVTPGEPERSYLVFKLADNHKHPNVGGKGERMPKKARQLPAWRINRIISWIKGGAHP